MTKERMEHLFKGKETRTNNPFILAIENEKLIKYSSFCRSLDSRLGYFIEKLAKEIVNDRFENLSDSEKEKVKSKTNIKVDLCFLKDGTWNVIELKAGGNIDSKKAKSERNNLDAVKLTVAKMKRQKTVFFYATAYKSFDENEAGYKNFSKEELLIGKDFWEFICDDSASYEYILKTFRDKFKEFIGEI